MCAMWKMLLQLMLTASFAVVIRSQTLTPLPHKHQKATAQKAEGRMGTSGLGISKSEPNALSYREERPEERRKPCNAV